MNHKLKVAIVDYDMGNISSIENAINHVGEYDIVVTSSASEIEAADCILLPGVGAFPDAMKKLREKGLIDTLNKVVIKDKKPTLGICLGMQLLFDTSDEITQTAGLGWIPGKVVYMKPTYELRVPHVGWNNLIIQNDSIIFDYLANDKDFYFVHSLHVQCDEKYVLAKFEYGSDMTASVQFENIVGMQFHPEKSQKVGLRAMKSFLDWAQKFVNVNNKEQY